MRLSSLSCSLGHSSTLPKQVLVLLGSFKSSVFVVVVAALVEVGTWDSCASALERYSGGKPLSSAAIWLPLELLIMYIHLRPRKQFETGLANKYCGHSIQF